MYLTLRHMQDGVTVLQPAGGPHRKAHNMSKHLCYFQQNCQVVGVPGIQEPNGYLFDFICLRSSSAESFGHADFTYNPMTQPPHT